MGDAVVAKNNDAAAIDGEANFAKNNDAAAIDGKANFAKAKGRQRGQRERRGRPARVKRGGARLQSRAGAAWARKWKGHVQIPDELQVEETN